MDNEYRRAEVYEIDAIYLMGFDVWSDGRPVEEFLSRCRESKKYQSGRRFLLREGAVLRSALLVHSFASWGDRVVRGIGSVAASPELRRQGYGHSVVAHAVDDLTARENARVLLPYSDIGRRFYERHGFRALPADGQTVPGSVPMLRMLPEYAARVLARYRREIPGYF